MRIFFVLIVVLFIGCSKDSANPTINHISFGQEKKVQILDYDGDIMEPFLTGNGQTLFFNNLNQEGVNTNLHYATKISNSSFQYQGELNYANTEYLDAVASMDNLGNLYFVSTRSYNQTLATIYKGIFQNNNVLNVELVEGITRNQTGWVNFDVEVSKDGNSLYFVDGRFDENGGPYEANLVHAIKENGIFNRTDNSVFEHINTQDLEYAACVSSDLLELYFTRVATPLLENSLAQIYYSKRNTASEAFPQASEIKEISGFVEAPTISPDNKTLYYHKKESGKYVLYMISKIPQ